MNDKVNPHVYIIQHFLMHLCMLAKLVFQHENHLVGFDGIVSPFILLYTVTMLTLCHGRDYRYHSLSPSHTHTRVINYIDFESVNRIRTLELVTVQDSVFNK